MHGPQRADSLRSQWLATLAQGFVFQEFLEHGTEEMSWNKDDPIILNNEDTCFAEVMQPIIMVNGGTLMSNVKPIERGTICFRATPKKIQAWKKYGHDACHIRNYGHVCCVFISSKSRRACITIAAKHTILYRRVVGLSSSPLNASEWC